MRRSPTRGLYDPASEHDSCGFGLIAQVDGNGSRAIVDAALEALSRMAHRGGVAADGLSGQFGRVVQAAAMPVSTPAVPQAPSPSACTLGGSSVQAVC